MKVWRESCIGDEIELVYGKSLPAHKRKEGPIGVYGSNGRVGHHSQSLTSGPGIIVGRKGSVGRVVYSDEDFWPIDTTYYVVNKNDHDWRFLFHLLSSIGLHELNSHSAVPGLNRQDAYSIPVRLPTKTEQRQIALALDTVENSIKFEETVIEKTVALKRTTMRELFTRGLRGEAQKETEIGPMPVSWECLPVSTLGEIVTGNTPPTKDSANYVGGEIPFIAPGDIEHGSWVEETGKFITDLGLERSRAIRQGSTCFVSIGSTIGKVGYAVPEICATNQQINSILPNDRFDPHFIFYLMVFWAEHIRKRASPSPVPILSKGVFEQIEIVTTTDREEQSEIAAVLDAIDRKIDLHRRKRDALDDLFKALLHKLMTGEICIADLDFNAIGTNVNEESKGHDQTQN